MNNTGWNAGNNDFGNDLKHILCHWHVHRFHNKLKTTYLHRKVNRRVDCLVDVIFFIQDNFFDYKRKSLLPNIDKRGIQRHEKRNEYPNKEYYN
uniref:Uncharacterized protein n=1 Tax=Amphimedon queenslandica TaxID=400682 RepID=A0A1X7UBJ5_AMPQE